MTTSIHTHYSTQNHSNLRDLRIALAPARLSRTNRLPLERGLTALKPIDRLDDGQLEQVIHLLESGRFRISPANWLRLRERAYQMALQEFGNRQLRNERTYEENRYDLDNLPDSPNLSWSSPMVRGYVVGLEDGRLARRIDHARAIPFCGLQVPVRLSEMERAQDAVSRVRWITGPVQCSRCDGYHLPAKTDVGSSVAPDLSRANSDSEIHCPHCQGSSLSFERDGLLLTAHCLCGWERVTTLLGLDPDMIEKNTQSLLAAPIRDVVDEDESLLPMSWDGVVETEAVHEGSEEELVESETGDLVETLVGMSEGAESLSDSEPMSSTPELDDPEIDLEALLTREMVQFWSSYEHRDLRRLLLDCTMRGELVPSTMPDETSAVSCERLGLVWTVAATLTQGCGRMSTQQQQEFVSWLVQSSDEELRQFLPEGTEESSLPPVYIKIRSWMRSCRERVLKFRSESAGVRLLSRQFGVSETAFRTAVQLTAVA